jgi:hypothetical protein
MKFTIESKYIDRPWKIFIWIFLIGKLLNFPLRFFRAYFTPEALYIFSIITIFTFIISVIIVGYLYSQTTKKVLENKLRFKVGLYVSIFTLIMGLFLVFITRGFFSISEIVINSIVNFFIVYYFLILGCKIYRK